MKQRSVSFTIRAEAEIVRQFSEMVRGALYTSHEMSCVFTGSLRVVCERTHRFRKITGSVNEPESNDPGMIPGTHYPCIFRNLCVKEALDDTLMMPFMSRQQAGVFSSWFPFALEFRKTEEAKKKNSLL